MIMNDKKSDLAWLDKIIEQQRQIQGDAGIALIAGACTAEEEIPIEELDQPRMTQERAQYILSHTLMGGDLRYA